MSLLIISSCMFLLRGTPFNRFPVVSCRLELISETMSMHCQKLLIPQTVSHCCSSSGGGCERAWRLLTEQRAVEQVDFMTKAHPFSDSHMSMVPDIGAQQHSVFPLPLNEHASEPSTNQSQTKRIKRKKAKWNIVLLLS